MSYEPTNWKSGDVVTSAKLNKMEGGIGNAGALIVSIGTDGTLNKTWAEIRAAALSGRRVTVQIIEDNAETPDTINDMMIGTLTGFGVESDVYYVMFYVGVESFEFGAQSEDGVLTIEDVT